MMHVGMSGMSDDQSKRPWDVRLADRWAREAKEAANDPKRYARPPLTEQVRSVAFWLRVAAGALFGLALDSSAPDWARAAAGGFYVLVLMGAAIARWRRRTHAR
jgi:hypothetical protein